MVRTTLCLWCLLAATAMADETPPTLLYLSDAAPVFMRFHVSVDGESYEEPWRKFVGSLFETFDKDGDGILDDSEARGINPQRLAQLGLPPAAQTRVAGISLGGDATKTDLGKYIRDITGDPLLISIQSTAQNTAQLRLINRRQVAAPVDLLKKLDTDQDGQLAIEELALTPRLRKLDLDDDDAISAAELQPFVSPYYRVASRPPTTSQSNKDSPFVQFSSATSETALVLRVLTRYDSEQADASSDSRLSKNELQIRDEVFDEFDRDEDGHLDVDELRRFVKAEPIKLDVDIDLHDGNRSRTSISLRQSEECLAFTGRSRTREDGSVALILGRVQIEFNAVGARQSLPENLVASYARLFARYDTDKNEYLDMTETSRSPFRATFALIDSDNNGQLFLNELSAYAKRVAAAQHARTTLTVANKGTQLFQVLDVNQDSRLTHLELIAGQQRIADWDHDGDGKVSTDEVPQFWRLTVSRGAQQVQAALVAGVSRPMAQTPNRPPTSGPVWFRSMDRNRDGAVSRREFLGELQDFAKLDENDDGIVSLSETSASLD